MILNKLGLPYEAISPDIDETVLPGEAPHAHVLRLAEAKARKIALTQSEALIIGSDSVCILNGEIMSKPETHEEAVRQLRSSSGKVIFFHTGLVLLNSKINQLQKATVTTEVHFKTLSDELIEAYLLRDQPYGCAGSIKVEGLGVILIDKMIAEDPNSVVGLPLIKLIEMLKHAQVKLLA
jgi:septum formation protein